MPLAVLTRERLLAVLQAAAEGHIPTEQLEAWANLVEVREDIGREPDFREELTEAVFELANPALTGHGVAESARKWVRRRSNA